MAVQYFKQAEVAGNSLATANLAARLITAGFAQEAVERLENAKQKHGKDVHRNVSLNIGRAAEAESDEETKVGEAVKRAGRVAKWKARFAEALIQEASTISGKFVGEDLTLEVDADGAVTGTLSVGLF